MSDLEERSTINEPYSEQNRYIRDKHIYDCEDRIRSNQEAYDKTILTLASSLFAASIALLEWLLSYRPEVLCLCFFISAIITFSLAILSVIISFFLGNKASNSSIDYANEYYKNRPDYEHERKLKKVMEQWNKYTTIANTAAGIFFFVGIISILIFTVKNF